MLFVQTMVTKYYFLLILSAIASQTAFGQQRKLLNQPKYDTRPIHFGFSLGISYYDFRPIPKVDLPSVPGFYDVTTKVSPGYNIAIISNLRLNNYMDLRFMPTFSAAVRYISFDYIDPYLNERRIKTHEVESSFILAPFELKFKSERINNHRWYVLGGITYANDLASKEKVEDDTLFKIRRQNVWWDAGVGIDIYFEYFKFSPQIKASFGINDLLVQDGSVPVSGLESLKSRCILINFTFE